MSSTIFPSPEAGAFFNSTFISVAVQLDTTAKDGREVRRWNADAHALISMYDIHAYPTYLIFTPDGEPLHRMVGARQTPDAFINETREAFDSTRAYYTRLRPSVGPLAPLSSDRWRPSDLGAVRLPPVRLPPRQPFSVIARTSPT